MDSEGKIHRNVNAPATMITHGPIDKALRAEFHTVLQEARA